MENKIPKASLILEIHSQHNENVQQNSFNYLPLEENQIANSLATLVVMLKLSTNFNIQPIKICLQEWLAYCSTIEGKIDGEPSYNDILQYIKY